MERKPTKPKRMGNHYVPPPARKSENDTKPNDTSRLKERPTKVFENRQNKLCNDSSLLFKNVEDRTNDRTSHRRNSRRRENKSNEENSDVMDKVNNSKSLDTVENDNDDDRPKLRHRSMSETLHVPEGKQLLPLGEENQNTIRQNASHERIFKPNDCELKSNSSPVPLASKSSNISSTNSNVAQQVVSVDDGEWDILYDDSGECLLPLPTTPNIPIQLKDEVKKATTPIKDSEERCDGPSSIIEVYGFSEELKTNDILAVFCSFIPRGFNLKWVDNTHALGILPTPALAEEVLQSCLPLVKTRPISQGSPLSQVRAQTLVLPSCLRPKTCPALARRLVSGALGLRVNVTPEERAAERELLREAREHKKLVSKQRDAAWEGNIDALSGCNGKSS